MILLIDMQATVEIQAGTPEAETFFRAFIDGAAVDFEGQKWRVTSVQPEFSGSGNYIRASLERNG